MRVIRPEIENNKIIAGFFAVFALVFVQSFYIAHATEYGDGPHHHSDQLCTISSVIFDLDDDIPDCDLQISVDWPTIGVATASLPRTPKALSIEDAFPRGPPA